MNKKLARKIIKNRKTAIELIATHNMNWIDLEGLQECFKEREIKFLDGLSDEELIDAIATDELEGVLEGI